MYQDTSVWACGISVSDQEMLKRIVRFRKKLLFLIGYLVASNHEAVEEVSDKVLDEESMINF